MCLLSIASYAGTNLDEGIFFLQLQALKCQEGD